MIEKPDAPDFRRHMATLREQWRDDREKSWWPNYGFHFTDIRNAVSIMKSDRLLSRASAKALIDTFADGASAQILDRTDEKWKDYVRFYFRPQTPTLYRNEGFISNPDNTPLKAHCPVPVYFLFDLESLLCRSDSYFSNGSLATDHKRVYSTALEFQNFLPDFQSVYHNDPFDSFMPEGWDIKFKRQAEIVVRDQIDLTDLKKVICRSQAEYESLRYLLGDTFWNLWQSKVGIDEHKQYFYHRRPYVKSVSIEKAATHFTINKSKPASSYTYIGYRIDPRSGKVINETKPITTSQERFTIPLKPEPSNEFAIRLLINGNLAYENSADNLYQARTEKT